jgi:putative tricarboxylic transport membrane protein
MILGPILENALMQSLILSHGSPLIFVKRPLAAVFVALLGLALLVPLLQRLFGRRVVPTTEEEM